MASLEGQSGGSWDWLTGGPVWGAVQAVFLAHMTSWVLGQTSLFPSPGGCPTWTAWASSQHGGRMGSWISHTVPDSEPRQ